MNNVTRILEAIQDGDPCAADELLPRVYDELRKLAAQRMREEGAGHTLQATALVHEAYLRLVGPQTDDDEKPRRKWDGKAHFFAAAAQAMRRILIDHARKKATRKRGGSAQKFSLEDADLTIDNPPPELLDLDDALTRLAAEDRVKAELVQLWFFAGLSLKEAGALLGLSPSTTDRYWAYARAMLYTELNRGAGESGS